MRLDARRINEQIAKTDAAEDFIPAGAMTGNRNRNRPRAQVAMPTLAEKEPKAPLPRRIPYAIRLEGEIVVMADEDASEDEILDEAWAAIRKSSHMGRLIDRVAIVRRHGVAPHRWVGRR